MIRLSAKYTNVNMISSVKNQGLGSWMLYDGTLNAKRIIEFMKRLIRGAAGWKIFLNLDNLRVHHAEIVKAWLEKHAQEIEIFYLPSYSPELNLDEYLNCDLKAGIDSRSQVRNQNELKNTVSYQMRNLRGLPERDAKYFQHLSIRYAA